MEITDQGSDLLGWQPFQDVFPHYWHPAVLTTGYGKYRQVDFYL
ncbi:MAG: hypothetical protein V7L25_20100 [Nostoc sp.]